MRQENQYEVVSAWGEQIDHLTARERADMEMGRAWACYINGGGGSPEYFDPLTWLRMKERQHSR